jgi:hypothetical protein
MNTSSSNGFKCFKFLGITLLILTFLSFCLLFVTPTLISTPWGKSKFLSVVNTKIPGSISIQDIHLSWFGNQSLTGFELKDAQKNSVLTGETFFIDKNLFSLLKNGLTNSEIQLTNLNATIVETHSGTTNLHQALGLEQTIENTEDAAVLDFYNPLTVVLNNVNGQFHLPSSFSEPVTVHLKGITKQDEIEGSFDINISCAGIDIGQCLQTKELTNFEKAAVGVKAKITNFPVALLDQVITTKQPELAGLTRAALGKTLDLDVEKFLANGEVQFKIHAKTPTLSSNLVGRLQADTFSLEPQSVISLLITPEFFKTLAKMQLDSVPTMRILNPAKGLLTINQLNIPIAFIKSTGDASADLAIDATLEIDQIDFATEGLFDATALQKVNVIINAPKASKTTTFQVEAEAMQGNKPFQINLKATIDKPANLDALFDNIYRKANMEANLTAIPMSFLDKIIGADNFLADGKDDLGALKVFTKPGKIYPEIDLSFHSNKLSLSNAHFQINQLKSPLNFEKLAEGDFSQLNLSGRLTCDSVSFNQNILAMPKMIVRNLDLPWKINAGANEIKWGVNGGLHLLNKDDIEGILKGEFRLINWLDQNKLNFKNSEIFATVSSEKFPVILLEALSKRNDLIDLFGPELDYQAHANLKGSEQWMGTIDVTSATEGIRSKAALKIGNNITLLHADQPATIEMTLTPKRFDILRKMLRKSPSNADSLELLGVTKITAVINSLDIPWRGSPQAVDGAKALSKMGIVASLAVEKFQVSDHSRRQQMAFENLTARFNSASLNQKISFQIATTETNHHAANDIIVNGDIRNAFSDTGEINLANLALNFEAKSKRLPASLFCQVACLEEDVRNKVEALFGDVLETDIKVQLQQMNGQVQATVNGSNGNISMDAQLNKGVLTLNKPAEATITVTPLLGKSILQDVIPILSGVISAENPIKISIDSKGFSIPLKPWDLSKVQLGQAEIDLGKMTFSNEGQLGTVFDLLKPSVNEKLTVWFTPIYLSMQEGTLKIKRMDLLMLSVYPLALWGKVDAIKEKIDMRIGLTGKALNQAFGISGMDKNYMMQIPLKGKMGEASIDKSKAAARISALIAQSKGGSHGLLLGTLLEIAGGGLTEEQVPASTTNPLPWSLDVPQNSTATVDTLQYGVDKEKSKEVSKDKSKEKNKDRSKSKSRNQQIEEGAASIINKFLK